MEAETRQAASDERASRVLHQRPTGPLVGFGLALAVIALAAILVTSPLAAGAPTGRSVSSAKPFIGKVTTARSLAYLGCGVTAKITKLPKFSLKTGVEMLAEKTTAKECASPLGYNTATATGDAGMWGKPFTPTAGLHHVVVQWTVRWSSTITAHLGPHQAIGQGQASTYLVAVLYLVDESNGTYLPAANSWTSYSHTSNGTFVTTPSASVTLYLNQTLLASNTYAIATWIYASSGSYAASTGGSTASATVSLANSGGSTVLTSIVRS
jgi:hypothetical protein